jgi:hypothetical protein
MDASYCGFGILQQLMIGRDSHNDDTNYGMHDGFENSRFTKAFMLGKSVLHIMMLNSPVCPLFEKCSKPERVNHVI